MNSDQSNFGVGKSFKVRELAFPTALVLQEKFQSLGQIFTPVKTADFFSFDQFSHFGTISMFSV